MSSDIKVSVIIPYHNSRESLVKLLNSIPDYEWLEVLIVNDHSDDISTIVSEFSRVKYLKQINGKRWAGAARNLGIQYSQGEYLVFADSDDYFLPEAFELIQSMLVCEFDLLFFSPVSETESGSRSIRHLGYKKLVEDYLESNSNDIKYRFHVPWSKVVKKDLVIKNDIYFDEVIASNDVNFSLKVACYAKKIIADNRSIYCVVESDFSLTKQLKEDVIDSRFEALARYNDFLININDPNLAAMSGHLYSASKFGFYKFLSRFFYCKYKRYRIFYSWSHIYSVLQRGLSNK
ncbi:glycosyltransferase family 2 protein [Shewanella sp. M16]|uniref:glycosyltransferase family 2 protein n=1 Tax=Shewanella sp. M16 TaxID=2830837 RepID=UPI001BAF6B1B|nr:glycosyltransferase family 2 protein [Shewanella sp. M16]MBS0043582.1 glycosyltransferase family 2 protein [Shewanella sp. M16]